MSGDMWTGVVLAIAAFASWILQGQPEMAFGSAIAILGLVFLPAYARKDTDKPASPPERWAIIGLGTVSIGAAIYQALV